MKRKAWPENCAWAEPADPDALGSVWAAEDAEGLKLDEDGQELLDIKNYFDELVESGRLDENYRLNEEYEEEYGEEEDEAGEPNEWEPEIGKDYWEDGAFDLEGWETALEEHISLLKTEPTEDDPAAEIEGILGYEFANENLMRQAFTRRAFAAEYGLRGDSETLEFLGDAALNMIVTREMVDRYLDVNPLRTDAPLGAGSRNIREGEMSRIRSHFVSGEYLAGRAAELGLDRYILYGSGEVPSDGAREDMMEALIGAVAVDSGWDQEALAETADRLIRLQLDVPDRYLKQSYYELFNAWHQKRFGRMPEYEIHGQKNGGDAWPFHCTIRFFVPENDRGVETRQRIDTEAESRSRAREMAAEFAYRFVTREGLWMNLKEAGITPALEDSINQIQELWQKKYLDAPAEYSFEEAGEGSWFCNCVCGGIHGFGRGSSKIRAKKQAAFMALTRLTGGE